MEDGEEDWPGIKGLWSHHRWSHNPPYFPPYFHHISTIFPQYCSTYLHDISPILFTISPRYNHNICTMSSIFSMIQITFPLHLKSVSKSRHTLEMFSWHYCNTRQDNYHTHTLLICPLPQSPPLSSGQCANDRLDVGGHSPSINSKTNMSTKISNFHKMFMVWNNFINCKLRLRLALILIG